MGFRREGNEPVALGNIEREPTTIVDPSPFAASGLPADFLSDLDTGYNHVPTQALGAGITTTFTQNIADNASRLSAESKIPNFGFNREPTVQAAQTVRVTSNPLGRGTNIGSYSQNSEGDVFVLVPRLSLAQPQGTVKAINEQHDAAMLSEQSPAPEKTKRNLGIAAIAIVTFLIFKGL